MIYFMGIEDKEYINTFANLHKTYEEVDGVTIKDTAYDTIPLYITDIKNKLTTILQNNEIDETYFSNTIFQPFLNNKKDEKLCPVPV